jgi:hypothetical protein
MLPPGSAPWQPATRRSSDHAAAIYLPAPGMAREGCGCATAPAQVAEQAPHLLDSSEVACDARITVICPAVWQASIAQQQLH